MSVLVIEDQTLLREILVKNLREEGYQVYAFESAEAYQEEEMDLDGKIQIAILDITLPGMSGLALSERLRNARSDLIIIILTMHGELDSKFKSLEAGANLYLTKPVDPKALSEAISRLKKSSLMIYSNMNVFLFNQIKQRIFFNDMSQALTFNEALVLRMLISSPETVESWELIEALDLDMDERGKKYLEVIVSRIRKKMKRLNSVEDSVFIQSVRGVGYQLLAQIEKI